MILKNDIKSTEFLNKSEVISKVDEFLVDKFEDTITSISLPAVSLLTWNRLDIAFKLLFLDLIKIHPDLASTYYYEDIKAITHNTFIERGNDKKNTFNLYKKDFITLFDNMVNNGFDSNKSIVPLSKENTIINGSHRVATAVKLDIDLTVVKSNANAMNCDFNFYYSKNTSKDILEVAVQKFIEYAENVYIAFLWPSGKDHKDLAISKFDNIIYQKDIKLMPNGALNLLIELYKGMDWTGNIENGYSGAKQKLLECFPDFEKFKVVVFQSKSLQDVQKTKAEVRDIYKIGYSSIHISDTKEEAIQISRLLFNDNGIHFLNFSNPYKYKQVHNEVTNFKKFIENNQLSYEDIIVSGSFILGLYGIRQNLDIDFLSIKSTDNSGLYETHNSQLKYYKCDKKDLLYNQKNYFMYDGLKFLSFHNLFEMKKTRNEYKDKNDLNLMKAVLTNNKYLKLKSRLKQNIFYLFLKYKNKLRFKAFNFLNAIGIYGIVRGIYRKIR